MSATPTKRNATDAQLMPPPPRPRPNSQIRLGDLTPNMQTFFVASRVTGPVPAEDNDNEAPVTKHPHFQEAVEDVPPTPQSTYDAMAAAMVSGDGEHVVWKSCRGRSPTPLPPPRYPVEPLTPPRRPDTPDPNDLSKPLLGPLDWSAVTLDWRNPPVPEGHADNYVNAFACGGRGWGRSWEWLGRRWEDSDWQAPVSHRGVR